MALVPTYGDGWIQSSVKKKSPLDMYGNIMGYDGGKFKEPLDTRILFYSPAHIPINWQIPKKGTLVVIGRSIFRLENVETTIGRKAAHLRDINTGETKIVDYCALKNPSILFIRK